PFSDQEEARRRFDREVRTLERVSHPSLVKFLAHGLTQTEERPYLEMELVEGTHLKQWATGKSHEEIVRAMRSIADALTYLHERDTLHRDIKPQNIMVRVDNEPVIVDFGLAYF